MSRGEHDERAALWRQLQELDHSISVCLEDLEVEISVLHDRMAQLLDRRRQLLRRYDELVRQHRKATR
jgi:predicted nuclease with TOPRIM domain